MSEYWFARFRVGANPSRGLAPLNWKGRAVIGGFVAALALGPLLFLFFALRDQFLPGIASFVVFAVVGAGAFLWAATTRSDPAKTIADYRSAGVLK